MCSWVKLIAFEIFIDDPHLELKGFCIFKHLSIHWYELLLRPVGEINFDIKSETGSEKLGVIAEDMIW